MTQPNDLTLSSRLLYYLRRELDNPTVQYRSPLTPLGGGFVTDMFIFTLGNVPEELAHPLVLRLFPQRVPASRVIDESLVHRILTTQKYPVPRVFFFSADTAILGKLFIIMEFIQGDNLRNLQSRVDGSQILADLLVELHTLDPTPIMVALKEHDVTSFNERNSVLRPMETRIPDGKLWWLQPGLEWVQRHQGKDDRKRVLCHGDMNLGNIMVDQGGKAVVLDWSGFFFCEPEYDLASIKIKFLYIAPFLTHMDYTEFYPKFITRYQRKIPIDTERLKYYEAMWCIRFLMWTEIIERLNAPGVQESLIHRFYEITGIMLKQS